MEEMGSFFSGHQLVITVEYLDR